MTIYQLKQAVYDEGTQKTQAVELFKSTSQIQILLYLRDMWYEINGWELPTDNPMWEDIKKKMREKEEQGNVKNTKKERKKTAPERE